MYHSIESFNKIQLRNPSNWSIQGYSKAGERTGFILHPLKITLDAGVNTFIEPVATVITHSHCDHTLSLPTLYSYRKKKLKGQEELFGRPIFMPKACELPVQKLMEAAILLSDNNPKIEKLDLSIKENIWKRQGYQPIIVKPDEHYPIYGIPNLYVEILQAYHNTETVGYGFYTKKRKLKKEYQNKTKQEIIDAKKNNMEIDTEVINYEVVYFCDSTIHNLEYHYEWKKYTVIICECTEFPEKHNVENYRDHTHLTSLERILKLNNTKQWILIHTSSAVKKDIILQHENRLRKCNINVTFVI